MASVTPLSRPVPALRNTGAAPVLTDRPKPAAAKPLASQWIVDVMERRDSPPNAEQVARNFYDAFTARDFATMEKLYAPDVKFKDAIFAYPDRDGAMGMWKKILGDPAQNVFKYEFKRMEGDVAIGVWTADYKVFGRQVHNVIESRMTVRDGKIVEHTDSFDFAKWAKQALPIGGLANVKPVQSVIKHVLRRVIG